MPITRSVAKTPTVKKTVYLYRTTDYNQYSSLMCLKINILDVKLNVLYIVYIYISLLFRVLDIKLQHEVVNVTL